MLITVTADENSVCANAVCFTRYDRRKACKIKCSLNCCLITAILPIKSEKQTEKYRAGAQSCLSTEEKAVLGKLAMHKPLKAAAGIMSSRSPLHTTTTTQKAKKNTAQNKITSISAIMTLENTQCHVHLMTNALIV